MISEQFTCCACGELRDFHSQAVIMGCLPQDAEFWVAGMPCIFSGFCNVCLDPNEDE